jgi:pimeloyl-ACP methyl ester carboxylesterase/DNA-binding CsgD family transcriptional regulator
MTPQVRFCTARDGTRIAYAIDGRGPPIVRGGFYMNHLELDWQCAVWEPLLRELTRGHSLLRHDMRGFGLSDRDTKDISLEAWVGDLEAVVDAAGLERFPLVAMCHGSPIAIEYAVRHPERVSHLVLYGPYARGLMRRHPSEAQVEEARVQARLVELGWGHDNEAFKQVWAMLLQPDSTLERLRSLADLQSRAAPAATALRLLRASAKIDVTEAARRVACPTLVLHAKGDLATPFEEGRLLASLIPGARLVPLASRNHVLAEEEPAWADFVRELRAFLPRGAMQAVALESLTVREAQILERMAQGLDNAQIAAHLEMAEKTVRNHITRIFAKLGVENRPQAIVRARECGYGEG